MSRQKAEESIEEKSSLSVGAIQTANEAKPIFKTDDLPREVRDMIANAIPVRKAVFHRTVIFHNKLATPETHYMSPKWSSEVKKHKVANMWLTPYVLICEQGGEYKFVPLANVSDITL